jgi:hypothetical protein
LICGTTKKRNRCDSPKWPEVPGADRTDHLNEKGGYDDRFEPTHRSCKRCCRSSRKRIALTLRMDDPVGAKADRPQADRGPRFNDRQMTSRGPAKQDSGGGALAEAMRRAAERGPGKAK